MLGDKSVTLQIQSVTLQSQSVIILQIQSVILLIQNQIDVVHLDMHHFPWWSEIGTSFMRTEINSKISFAYQI